MTITLKVGENPLLEAIKWAGQAEKYRSEGNGLMAYECDELFKQYLQMALSGKVH